MPLYEYACRSCGHELEANQKISDPTLTDCPSCGESSLERIVSRSSFALRGSGWYADGYGSKKSGSGDEGKKASAKSAEKSPSASDAGASSPAATEKKSGGE